MNREQYDYTAFISYKRGGNDEYWAAWLQRKLERYRIPAKLLPDRGEPEKEQRARRLKIFRDKTDLGSHTDLEHGLHSSLESCRFLIVICSPRSAASPYVADEVRHFMNAGREEYIVPFIIEGSPVPGDAAGESCYPPTLPAHCLGITRAEGSKEEALMKVLARLLQVEFAFLYQRHLRAQRRSMLTALAVGVAVLLAVSALAAWALNAERRATVQREEAEGLVEFLVGDLGDEAFRYVPLRIRRIMTGKAEQYYERWGRSASDAGLLSRARHLRNLAANARAAGKYGVMLEELLRARDILDGLMARHPEKAAVRREACEAALGLFEAAWSTRSPDVGDFLKKALALAEGYASQTLADADARAKQQSLLAEAHAAEALYAKEQGDEDKAVQATRDEVAARERECALNPESLTARGALSRGLLDLYKRLRERGHPDAEKACARSLQLAEEAARADPFSQDAQERLAHARLGMAYAHFSARRDQDALDLSRKALGGAQRLAAHDPDSLRWQANAGVAMAFRGVVLQAYGEISPAEALDMIRKGGEQVERYAAAVKGTAHERSARDMLFWYREAQDSLAKGADEANIVAALDRAREDAREKPGDIRSLRLYARQARYAFLALSGAKTPSDALALAQEAREANARYRERVPSDYKAAIEDCGLLVAMGNLLLQAGDGGEAKNLLTAAADAAVKLTKAGVKNSELYHVLSDAHAALGQTLADEGDCENARPHFSLSLDFMRAAKDAGDTSSLGDSKLVLALWAAGNSLFRLGESAQGLPLLREAADLARDGASASKGALRPLALDIHSQVAGLLGLDLCLAGQGGEGAALLDEGLRAARESADPETRIVLLGYTARSFRLLGDTAQAARAAEEAWPAARERLQTGNADTAPLMIAYEMGTQLLHEKRPREALALAAEAMSRALSSGRESVEAARDLALLSLLKGEALLGTGDAPGALNAHEEGLACITLLAERSPREMEWGLIRAGLLRGTGDALAAAGRIPAANEAYARSLDVLRRFAAKEPQRLDSRRELARTLEQAAASFEGSGQKAEAQKLRQEAARLGLDAARPKTGG